MSERCSQLCVLTQQENSRYAERMIVHVDDRNFRERTSINRKSDCPANALLIFLAEILGRPRISDNSSLRFEIDEQREVRLVSFQKTT